MDDCITLYLDKNQGNGYQLGTHPHTHIFCKVLRCFLFYWLEDRDVAKHPTTPRTASITKNWLRLRMVSSFKNLELGLYKGMHFSKQIKWYILDFCIS